MNAISKTDHRDVAAISPEIMEVVLAEGDLSRLTPKQRVTYYVKVCESQGLNPLTRPFDYLRLNGKLVLYAKRECTDQKRKIDGISIEIVDKRIEDDLFIATAHAKNAQGREDEDVGAVTISGLKGEAKANAILKAVTKAKRRVTLSICGMGMLDETEVDSIQGAQKLSREEVEEEPRQVHATVVRDQSAQRQPMNRLSSDELDQATGSDHIPDWDAPKPDRLRKVADRIMQRLSEAQTADAYNEIMTHTGIQAEWDKIKAERPELADEIEQHRQEQLDRIAEASDAAAHAEPAS